MVSAGSSASRTPGCGRRGRLPERRKEALEPSPQRGRRSSVRLAKALDPMNSADRKVVHDAVNEIEGVVTVSEGEDEARRVVIRPA